MEEEYKLKIAQVEKLGEREIKKYKSNLEEN